jgi:hypothetical protein
MSQARRCSTDQPHLRGLVEHVGHVRLDERMEYNDEVRHHLALR